VFLLVLYSLRWDCSTTWKGRTNTIVNLTLFGTWPDSSLWWKFQNNRLHFHTFQGRYTNKFFTTAGHTNVYRRKQLSSYITFFCIIPIVHITLNKMYTYILKIKIKNPFFASNLIFQWYFLWSKIGLKCMIYE